MGVQFGDTTYTKVFVGGLAWETQKDTMKKYFEQFGDILEAVIIADKHTGRSKGYGFVTFRDSEAATKACVDPSPVIDGRRANCNLASLGAQRSKPASPQHGGKKSFVRVGKGFQSGAGAAFASAATFPHHAIQQGIPYNVYGYSTYSPEYTYPTSFYNVYGGGATSQYPVSAPFYPYFHRAGGAYSYGMQYPHAFQYSAMASTAAVGLGPHFGGASALPPQPGMNMAAAVTVVSAQPLA